MRFNARVGVATATVVALSVVLSGCGAGSSPQPDSSGEAFATVDTMFGEVVIPKPADGELTVVALGWSDAEVALALGVKPVAVYDWQGFGVANHGVGPWAAELFGSDSPVVIERGAGSGEVDYEQIQSLNPDLILNVRSANDEEQFRKLSSIAPTVFGPKDAPAYATEWRDHTRLVAAAVGEAEKGDALVTDVEEQISAARSAHPEFTGLTAVTGSKFGDAYGVSLPGDFRWDLLEQLGFSLTPRALELPSQGFYAPVSAEQVSVFDTDVAVLFPIGFSLAELEADRLVTSLDVVKDGRAVLLEGTGDLSQAFSAASIISIPLAVEGMVPLLAEAAAKDAP